MNDSKEEGDEEGDDEDDEAEDEDEGRGGRCGQGHNDNAPARYKDIETVSDRSTTTNTAKLDVKVKTVKYIPLFHSFSRRIFHLLQSSANKFLQVHLDFSDL